MNGKLTKPEQNKRMEEMVELLKETNALREPILQIQAAIEETKNAVEDAKRTLGETKGAVEETKITVEETKRTVEDIFKSIKGTSHSSICAVSSYCSN